MCVSLVNMRILVDAAATCYTVPGYLGMYYCSSISRYEYSACIIAIRSYGVPKWGIILESDSWQRLITCLSLLPVSKPPSCLATSSFPLEGFYYKSSPCAQVNVKAHVSMDVSGARRRPVKACTECKQVKVFGISIPNCPRHPARLPWTDR